MRRFYRRGGAFEGGTHTTAPTARNDVAERTGRSRLAPHGGIGNIGPLRASAAVPPEVEEAEDHRTVEIEHVDLARREFTVPLHEHGLLEIKYPGSTRRNR